MEWQQIGPNLYKAQWGTLTAYGDSASGAILSLLAIANRD